MFLKAITTIYGVENNIGDQNILFNKRDEEVVWSLIAEELVCLLKKVSVCFN